MGPGRKPRLSWCDPRRPLRDHGVISIPELASPVSTFPFLRSSRRHRARRVPSTSRIHLLSRLSRPETAKRRARERRALATRSRYRRDREREIPRNNTKILHGRVVPTCLSFVCFPLAPQPRSSVMTPLHSRKPMCLYVRRVQTYVHFRESSYVEARRAVYVPVSPWAKRFQVVLCFLTAFSCGTTRADV